MFEFLDIYNIRECMVDVRDAISRKLSADNGSDGDTHERLRKIRNDLEPMIDDMSDIVRSLEGSIETKRERFLKNLCTYIHITTKGMTFFKSETFPSYSYNDVYMFPYSYNRTNDCLFALVVINGENSDHASGIRDEIFNLEHLLSLEGKYTLENVTEEEFIRVARGNLLKPLDYRLKKLKII